MQHVAPPRIYQAPDGRFCCDARRPDGTRLRHNLDTRDPSVAVQRAVELVATLEGRSRQLSFERFTLAAAVERYRAGDAYATLAAGGQRAVDEHSRAVVVALGADTDVNTVDWPAAWTAALGRWRAAGLADTTANKRRGLLVRILRWSHDPLHNGGSIGRVRAVPDLSFYRRAANRPRVRWLTRPEFLRVSSALPSARSLWLAVACWTGQRYSDVERMTWADVDPGAGTWRRYHTKTHGARHFDVLPLPPELRAALSNAPRPIDSATAIVGEWHNLRRDVAIVCKRLGIPRFSAHDCRRTCATWLLEMGASDEQAREWLGLSGQSRLLRLYGRRGPRQAARRADVVTLMAKYARAALSPV